MGMEYVPPLFLLALAIVVFVQFQFWALPRLQQFERERKEEEKRKAPTEAPESHSKSAE
jgi:hypothetical protein